MQNNNAQLIEQLIQKNASAGTYCYGLCLCLN